MVDWLRESLTDDTPWQHLHRLADVEHRMAGSDGERRAAEATRDALAAHCDDARLETFDVQGWTRGDSAIRVGGTEQSCIALPRSPAAEVTGEVLDLGYGLPDDFAATDVEGAVVVVDSDVPGWYDRYIHRREKYYRAVEGGAAAFVYRNHVEGCLPPTGSVGSDAEPIGEIPAVGVSAEVGKRLGRRFDGEAATVTVEAEAHDATSQNVHAELGPDTDERLLVTSHVDAHDISEGALDNGAGTAMVLAVARALSRRAADLDTKVEFVAFGAEEVGLCGSSHAASETDLDSVRAVVNLDGVVHGRTLKWFTHGFPALREAAENAADRFGFPVQTPPTMNPHSDHWPFVAEGVPGMHAMSDGGQGRGWGHTAADTVDKLDRRDFVEQAILVAETVARLARGDEVPERRPRAAVRDQLADEDLAEGMRLAGDWPYDD